MPQAWQVRDIERKNLLEELGRLADEFAEKTSLGMGGAVTASILAREIMKRLYRTRLVDATCHCDGDHLPTTQFLKKIVYPKIKVFSRSEVERQALVARFLLDYLLPAALNPYLQDLHREEIDEPERIFGKDVKRGSDEIPWPEETITL